MPSLSQVWSEISAVAAGLPSRPSPPSEDAFAEMLLAYFETIADSRKAATIVAALRDNGLGGPEDLGGADFRELEAVAKETGVSLKPAAIKTAQRLAAWVVERGGNANELRNSSPEAIRDELRSIQGIGSTTADAILLFGLGLPSYPVDRATYRILVRHGWIDANVEYDEARDAVVSAVGDSPERLAEASRTFERLGKEFCKVGEPKCERCVLRPWLPDGGPVQG